jgi:hypothetical protein
MIKKIQRRFAELWQTEHKAAWLLDQWKWRYFAFRHKEQARLNIAFDLEHGVETATELPLQAAGVPLADIARGNGVYRPLTEKLFRAAISSIGIDPSTFAFVDIGSGKGKVLFMAADLPFKRIVGIEYAAGLHQVALRNVATYRSPTQRCSDIEPVHADALDYVWPKGPLVLFIFNALAKDIMRELLKKLDAEVAVEPERPIILIYTNLRSVNEVDGVFSGLQNLQVFRRLRHFVAVANQAGGLLIS